MYHKAREQHVEQRSAVPGEVLRPLRRRNKSCVWLRVGYAEGVTRALSWRRPELNAAGAARRAEKEPRWTSFFDASCCMLRIDLGSALELVCPPLVKSFDVSHNTNNP